MKHNSQNVKLLLRHRAHSTHWRPSETAQWKHQIITKTSRSFITLTSEWNSENIKLSLSHHAHLTHWRQSETQQSKHQIITKTSRAFNTLTSEWNSENIKLSQRHHAHLTHTDVRVKHNRENIKLSLRHYAHLTHWPQPRSCDFLPKTSLVESCFTSTETVGLSYRDGSPGQPP